jgi:signal transduction histidine kinase
VKHRDRRWWIVFGLCTMVVLAAMSALSIVMLALERESETVRIRESALRVALWRMDSFLAPYLAREAARPYYEYQPFFEADTTYTRMYSEVAPGSLLAPSPLLTDESDYFPIHFHVGVDGAVTSPQVPEGNELDLAEATLLQPGEIDRRRALLERARELMDVPAMAAACSSIESRMRTALSRGPNPPVQTLALQQQQSDVFESQREENLSLQESQKRAEYNWRNQLPLGVAKGAAEGESPGAGGVGALVPLWRRAQPDAPVELLFVRRVVSESGDVYQGFLVDWSALRAALLDQVSDLFAESSLAAVVDGADSGSRPQAQMLAAIPAALEGIVIADGASPLVTPARLALAVTWLAVLGAIAAAGFTLRASIDYGERRSRFASAVTHELRTPLTTFELYAGMLAEGMVKDPARAAEYHATLRDEAERLSAIVENVLAYAQVEEGRLARSAEMTTPGEAMARIMPPLQRRAARCGAALTCHVEDPEAKPSRIDVETVGQILFNLVDNACKYACAKPGDRIDIVVRADDHHVEFCVRDHGPGVPPSMARRIFEPFDRGPVAPGSASPGVGIGLTLSRELARAMGGSLSFSPAADGRPGACFILTLP